MFTGMTCKVRFANWHKDPTIISSTYLGSLNKEDSEEMTRSTKLLDETHHCGGLRGDDSVHTARGRDPPLSCGEFQITGLPAYAGPSIRV